MEKVLPMKHSRTIFLASALAILLISSTVALADDLLISGTISGTATYDSDEGIVFEDAQLDATAIVTATSNFEVYLKPGTSIASGASLTITMRDNDGLSNRCEMQYFGDLTHNPDDDDDDDQLTNYQECELGYNPNEKDLDNDDDGLPDGWEVQYIGLTLDWGPNDDSDGDGISNLVEYKLGTDPAQAYGKSPGIYYEYDKLGRVIKIERLPSQ
jgi:hypothetical protein